MMNLRILIVLVIVNGFNTERLSLRTSRLTEYFLFVQHRRSIIMLIVIDLRYNSYFFFSFRVSRRLYHYESTCSM